MTGCAPVGIFIFNRPEHLRRTLELLLCCPEAAASPLYVFADGARNNVDLPAVEAARQVARELLGARAQYHFAGQNMGLSRSIIHGTNLMLAEHGRAIVLEDDLAVRPEFLGFMNRALERYAESPSVMQISGYMFNVREARWRARPYLLPFPSSWGWATWSRAWKHFDITATGWEALGRDRQLRRRFNLDGVYDYASMLEAQMNGVRDSWAVRWYWTLFQRAGLVVYPAQSLVRNTGFDGSGTHGRGFLRGFGRLDGSAEPIPADLSSEPSLVYRDFAAVRDAIWKQNGGLLGHSFDRARRALRRVSRR